jgi:ketosteroid isomerase-like protein
MAPRLMLQEGSRAMTEHPNAELWRRAQAAFSSRDFSALREFWSDDIVYHFPGKRRLAGDYRGIQAVVAFFGELVATNVQITEVHDVLASDEHVVALVRGTVSRHDQEMSIDGANVYYVRDGKITEAWLLSTNEAALDEFLS